jgi:glyoxylase-like metal-dependent hydrolase (beta-lactamase superfamily II)
LIYGENDAVLVDAMTTVAEAEALADWIALHNRNLETIYITHALFDHFYGLCILLDRFPGARDCNTQDGERDAGVFYSRSRTAGPPYVSRASGHSIDCA